MYLIPIFLPSEKIFPRYIYIFFLTIKKVLNTQNQKNAEETNGIKTEMLGLFKKQKDLISKNLELKRRQYQEIVSRQRDIEEMARQMLTDNSRIEAILRILMEFRSGNSLTNTQNKNMYLDNLCLESETQKKIMFLALKLASEPAASATVQRQRREFYDKSKRKLAKLEKKTSKEVAEARETAVEMQNAINSSKSAEKSERKLPSVFFV